MASGEYPPLRDDPSPLVIASRNYVPGSAGWKADELLAEFGQLRSRAPVKLGPTSSILAGLGVMPVNGVNPQGTQFLMQAATFVGTPSGGVLSVPYPQAFPNGGWLVVCVFGDSPGLSLAHVGTIGTSTFNFHSGSTGGMRVNYFALGY